MAMFGKERIEISDNLDSDLEASIYIEEYYYEAYVNKADAIAIINHLKNLFDIEDE